ncbi:glutaredoxin domain-containing protein [Limnohabitans sp. WS1]|uniref:glutaredoxin domain-containing protein n=1 Tax=Limnohabitans sp. WS1 TaxID=1100726 RepID=UPI000D3A000F|nr:glutaredoxin domain-containing protein [Limnohabitans sp. WS1]PUE13845.1 glutaredoxin [Limnohabitans sp. WS1]
MTRPLLDESAIHPAIRQRVSEHHLPVITRVQTAIAQHPVVVVGLSGNPYVGKARKALTAAGVAHEYIEFGSYFSQWRLRNALKMWTGWPTFPMVFVRGTMVGGADDLRRLIDSGELQTLLKA